MLFDVVISFLNLIIKIIGFLFELISKLLPTSPFSDMSFQLDSEWLGYINWFIPLGFFIKVSILWATAVLGYKLISFILRRLKIIS